MLKRKSKEIIETIGSKPILSSFLVFALAFLIVIGLTLIKYEYDRDFYKNILVEAHGMLFDILVIGIFIFTLHKLGEKRAENIRYQEEIDDFRYWKSEEAKFRIIGNIRRLNRNGFTRINLSYINMSGANLQSVNLQGANLLDADFLDSDLSGVDFSKASLRDTTFSTSYLQRGEFVESNLQNTLFQLSNLQNANFLRANLDGTRFFNSDIREAKNLTIEQLSKARTLYMAKLDSNLMEQVENKCPQLLEEPKKNE